MILATLAMKRVEAVMAELALELMKILAILEPAASEQRLFPQISAPRQLPNLPKPLKFPTFQLSAHKNPTNSHLLSLPR